jgi:hypothetical protein
MYMTMCSLAVALEDLDGDRLNIHIAKGYLSQALTCARSYQKTLDSIYWRTARPWVKRQKREQMHHFAFDTCMFLENALSALEREEEQNSSPSVTYTKLRLSLAHETLLREHSHQICWKQLRLFEIGEYGT